MRALLTATVILLVAVPAVAQPKKQKQADISATRLHVIDTVNQSRATKSASPNPQVDVSATGWTFYVVKMKHNQIPGLSTIKHDPYGVFASRDECEMARAKVVADLDDGDFRQFHPIKQRESNTDNTSITRMSPNKPDSQTTYINSTFTDNNSRRPSRSDPVEFMDTTVCRDAAVKQIAQQN
jgi:hypothetical protein